MDIALTNEFVDGYNQLSKDVFETSYSKHCRFYKGSPLDILAEYRLHNADNNIYHTSYDMEVAQLNAIKNGDFDEYLKAVSTFKNNSIGLVANNAKKNMEYNIVSGITLYTRAAIAGGVPPYLAYDISDVMLQQVSGCETLEDYNRVMNYAVKTFIDLVNETKKERHLSIYVENAKEYIIRHLNKNCSVDEIAGSIGIDKAYLMRLFKKNEGITLGTYAQMEKVRAGKNMLTYSDYSIEEIAHYLQFSSQSHFGAVFKKYTGTSPAKYRKIVHANDKTGFTPGTDTLRQ